MKISKERMINSEVASMYFQELNLEIVRYWLNMWVKIVRETFKLCYASIFVVLSMI